MSDADGTVMQGRRRGIVEPPRAARARDAIDFERVTDTLLWMVICSSATVGLALLSPGSDFVQDRSGYTHYYSLVLAVTGLLLFVICSFARLMSARNRRPIYRVGLLVLLPYIGVALSSNLYSADPEQTMFSSIRLVAYLGAIIAYSAVRGPAAYLRVIVHILLFINVVSTLTAIFIPSIGVHFASDIGGYAHVGDWKGITVHKNVLGPYASLGAFLVLLYPHVTGIKGGLRNVMFGCCILNMMMAQSSSAIIAFVVCMTVYYVIFHGRMSLQKTIVGTLLLILCGIAAYFLQQGILTLLGKDSNLSGRTQIWAFCLDKIARSPYLGYGFNASSGYFRDEMQKHLFAQAVDAHNGYLQIMLDLGGIGLGCFLFSAIRSIIRGSFQSGGQSPLTAGANQALALCILWSLIAGFAEIGPMCLPSPLSFVSFGAIACIGVAPRLRRRAAVPTRRVFAV